MTAATTSNWQCYIGTAASPQVLTSIEEVFSISGVGKTNELIDVTNFDSAAGTMEYIAGRADGAEFTVECNYVPGATHQPVVMTAVDSQATRLARIDYTGSSPNKTWSFSAVCLGYEISPSVDDRNTITFTFKVTGDITRA
jgi:hypothetical protein